MDASISPLQVKLVASSLLTVMVHCFNSDRGPMPPPHMMEPEFDKPPAPPQPCCNLPLTAERLDCVFSKCYDGQQHLNSPSNFKTIDCGPFILIFNLFSQVECCVIQLKNSPDPIQYPREILSLQCMCVCELAATYLSLMPVNSTMEIKQKTESLNFTQTTEMPLSTTNEKIQKPLAPSTEVYQTTLGTMDPSRKHSATNSTSFPGASTVVDHGAVLSNKLDTTQRHTVEHQLDQSTSQSGDLIESKTETMDLDRREKSASFTAAITNGVLIGGFVVIFGVALFVFIRRRKRKKLKSKTDVKCPASTHPAVLSVGGNGAVLPPLTINISQKKSNKLEEIPRKNIRLLNVLGKGMFGTVVKAEVYCLNTKGSSRTGDWTTVAVKMTSVSDTKNEEAKTDFLAEVYLMKSIPPHRNVISIYGSCTGQDPYMMLLEFAANGDLKKRLVQMREEKDLSSTTHGTYDNMVFQIENSRVITAGNNDLLSLKTMMSFALQICRGLDHLAINKIVHRDVAARNILLFEYNVVKISDFGLARRVGESDIYERTRKGLLPVRWMSPETLMFNQFSEKSDVWSFGVLLWEMVTLGLTPYCDLDVDHVVEKIKGGELLQCPVNSPGEMQTMMLSCWHSSPACRPKFSEMCKQLEKVLEEHSDYIDLDVPDEYSTVT